MDALCKKYDIDLSVRKYHGALLDAKLLADVYLELTGGRQRSLALEVSSSYSKDEQVTITKVDIEYRKPIMPSDDELESHKKFLETNVKDNIW